MDNQRRRVAITGVGVVSPAGTGKEKFWKGITAGRSCIRRIDRFDTSGLQVTIAGQVRDFESQTSVDPALLNRHSLVTRYAMVAATQALEDAGLRAGDFDRRRAGVALGSSMGGTESSAERSIERVVRHESGYVRAGDGNGNHLDIFPGHIVPALQHHLEVDGISTLIATGCTAASDAIGFAYLAIRDGAADVMFGGGTEAPIGRLTIQAFDLIGALSHRNDEPERASRPFDRNRDGFVVAEGAGMLLLEEMEAARRRGAHIYGEIVGYQTTCDAYHLTSSDPKMSSAVRAITSALAEAGLAREQVDHINAHATATPMNDSRETGVIKTALGVHAYKVPITGIKATIGHASGSAGGLQAVASALTFQHGVVPPTVNLDEPDPECDLDYVPNHARPVSVKVILQNTYAFSGKNVALLYRRAN
jgi:3-oxoacyl-[acyl-carrier-protein] synthase II